MVLSLMFGCAEKVVKPRVEDKETTPTQIAIDLISIESRNGVESYRMTTPLMERYELATKPFAEFRKGILVETFDDTTQVLQSSLRADYAHFDETDEIWEVRGKVVGQNIEDGKKLFTEQLFWNQKTDRIYTDKFARIIDGQNEYKGVGFESDGKLKNWSFHTPRGTMEVSLKDSTQSDSTQVASPGALTPGNQVVSTGAVTTTTAGDKTPNTTTPAQQSKPAATNNKNPRAGAQKVINTSLTDNTQK